MYTWNPNDLKIEVNPQKTRPKFQSKHVNPIWVPGACFLSTEIQTLKLNMMISQRNFAGISWNSFPKFRGSGCEDFSQDVVLFHPRPERLKGFSINGLETSSGWFMQDCSLYIYVSVIIPGLLEGLRSFTITIQCSKSKISTKYAKVNHGQFHQKLNGKITNGPRSVSCDRALRYSGFFGFRETWVLLEISSFNLN